MAEAGACDGRSGRHGFHGHGHRGRGGHGGHVGHQIFGNSCDHQPQLEEFFTQEKFEERIWTKSWRVLMSLGNSKELFMQLVLEGLHALEVASGQTVGFLSDLGASDYNQPTAIEWTGLRRHVLSTNTRNICWNYTKLRYPYLNKSIIVTYHTSS